MLRYPGQTLRNGRWSDDLYIKLAKLEEVELRHAAPFFWGREATSAVMVASRSVPPETRISRWNLPTDAAWWWFEDAVLQAQTMDNDVAGLVQVRALLLFWTSASFFIVPWADSERYPGTLFPCSVLKWPEGLTIADMRNSVTIEVNGASVNRIQAQEPAFVMAALAWIEQRVAAVTVERIERPRRREFQKATGQASGDVQVVQLRRTEHAEETGEPGEGRYACRWTVGGHWRQQPCGPARAERRLTWVHPYLKGPDGMPFREPRVKMYAVTR